MDKICIQPTTPIALNNDARLHAFVQSFIKNNVENNYTATAFIRGIESIDAQLDSAKPKNESIVLSIKLNIEKSIFRLSLNGTLVNGCTDILPNSTKVHITNSLFTSFDRVRVSGDTRVTDKICAYAFRNAKMISFELAGQVNHFIKQNVMQFLTIDDFKNTELNSDIAEFSVIDSYNFNLDANILPSVVFNATSSLKFGYYLASIETGLFKSFGSLRALLFRLSDLRTLFYNIGLSWLEDLNADVKNYTPGAWSEHDVQHKSVIVGFATKTNSLVDSSSSSSSMLLVNQYQYNDADHCLFQNFPLERLVFPLVGDVFSSNFTCTVILLMQRYTTYSYYLNLTDDDWKLMANRSEIISRAISKIEVDICKNKTAHTAQTCSVSGKASSHNWAYNTQNGRADLDVAELEYTFSVVMIPLACVLGLLLNVKTIWTIWDKRRQETCWVLMSINAKLNCLYCLIYLLNLFDVCVDPLGVFCSAVYASSATQYFKIIVIVYGGECVKVCANIAFLLMTLNRYTITGQNHAWVFKKISELSVIKILIISTIFSLLFNAIYLFQYDVNPGTGSDGYSQPEDYPIVLTTRGLTFEVFFFIRCLLNYVLFAFSITCLEILIALKLHRELTGSKRRMAVVSYSEDTNEVKISKIEEAVHKIEHRAIALMMFNAFVYFVLRFPELFALFQYTRDFSSNYVYVYFCEMLDVCDRLPEYANFFYILTFSTNYFMYFVLRKTFNRPKDIRELSDLEDREFVEHTVIHMDEVMAMASPMAEALQLQQRSVDADERAIDGGGSGQETEVKASTSKAAAQSKSQATSAAPASTVTSRPRPSNAPSASTTSGKPVPLTGLASEVKNLTSSNPKKEANVAAAVASSKQPMQNSASSSVASTANKSLEDSVKENTLNQSGTTLPQNSVQQPLVTLPPSVQESSSKTEETAAPTLPAISLQSLSAQLIGTAEDDANDREVFAVQSPRQPSDNSQFINGASSEVFQQSASPDFEVLSTQQRNENNFKSSASANVPFEDESVEVEQPTKMQSFQLEEGPIRKQSINNNLDPTSSSPTTNTDAFTKF
jgi:hypothetical protein